jgi:hypothetical protein
MSLVLTGVLFKSQFSAVLIERSDPFPVQVYSSPVKEGSLYIPDGSAA